MELLNFISPMPVHPPEFSLSPNNLNLELRTHALGSVQYISVSCAREKKNTHQFLSVRANGLALPFLVFCTTFY